MSTHATSAVRMSLFGSPTKKAIMLVLADYADQNGTCYPSQKRIAVEAEVQPRTVIRTIAELIEDGYIQKSAPTRRGYNNLYTLVFKNFKKADYSPLKPCDNLSLSAGDNLSPSPPDQVTSTTRPSDTSVTPITVIQPTTTTTPPEEKTFSSPQEREGERDLKTEHPSVSLRAETFLPPPSMSEVYDFALEYVRSNLTPPRTYAYQPDTESVAREYYHFRESEGWWSNGAIRKDLTKNQAWKRTLISQLEQKITEKIRKHNEKNSPSRINQTEKSRGRGPGHTPPRAVRPAPRVVEL